MQQQAPVLLAQAAAAGGPSPMDIDTPAGGPAVGGGPDWNRIPADVIGHLLRGGLLDERDARCILATSSQWRAAAKEQLPALSPLCLGTPAAVAPTAFRGVAALNCRALRARGFGASRRPALPTGDPGGGGRSSGSGGGGADGSAGGADARAAGSSSGGGAAAVGSSGGAAGWDDADSSAARARAGAQPLPSPHGAPRPHIFVFVPPVGDLPGRLATAFPRVSSVDLSGQELPPGSGAALGNCTALKDLQLRSCRVGFEDMTALLRALRAPGGPALRVLGVGDVRVRGAPEGTSLGDTVASIGLPPSLRSLHAGLFLRARERPAALSDRLDLKGHLAALLGPLGRLTTLGLDEQRLEQRDWEAVTNATALRDLSISWWPPGPDGGLDPAHLRCLTSLPRLSRLRLALHGRGGFYEPLSLAGLTALRELEMSGCRSLPLALSLAELTGLERLVLTACGEAVSTNVLVMILRSTPNLQLLSLRSMALNQELRAPGDEILHHLAACCPRLKALMLGDTAALGTGLRQPGAWAAAAMGLGGPGSGGGGGGLGGGWLRGLTEVELCGTQLLRSSLLHLSSLESLECLTLRSVPPAEFAHAARLGCLRGLSQLGRTLRTLRVIASADAPAPGPREPHLHFLTALTALEHLELGVLHTSGACLSHLSPLTRLQSLHAGGALHLTRQGVAALAALRLPHLETLSLVDLAWRQPWEGPAGGTGPGMVVSGGAGGGPAIAAGRITSSSVVGSSGASGSGTGGGEEEALALAVLRSLPAVTPCLRYLRLGSCSGATATPLAHALAALPGLEALQLLELPVLADDLIAELTGRPDLSSCRPSAPFGTAAAAAHRKPQGPRPLVGVDVRSSEELAQMRAAARATAGLVAAAATGGGDLLEAAAGHASVEAAAAAVGQAAPWPAVPAGGQGGGGPGGGGPGGAGGGAAGGAVAAAFAAAAGLAGWDGDGEGGGGAGGGQGPPTATRGRLYSYRLTRTTTGALVVHP